MTLAHALAPYIFFSGHDDDAARSTSLPETHDVVASTSAPSTSQDLHDRVFATRIRAGDETVMRDVVRTYADSLVRFALMLVHDRATAEAVAYDVLADIWMHRDRVRVDGSLRAYIFTAARRRALDMLARERTRDRYTRNTAIERSTAYDSTPWSAPSPETLFLDRTDEAAELERVAMLRSAIAALPGRRRLALHLRFEAGLSFPAIGKVLGLSDKAAQQLVLRTIGALRRALEI